MKPRMLRALMVVFSSSMTVRLMGLAKNVLAAHYFGTSGAMDAYLLALLLPDMAMQLAYTGAFNFIPVFAAERARSEQAAWRAAGQMLGYWLLLLLAVLVLVLVLSPQLVGLLAPGLGAEGRQETVELTRLLLLMASAVGLARLLAVTLHADRKFVAVALAEAVFQLVSTVYLVVFHARGIEALAGAQICGGFAQLLVVAAGLLGRRRGLRLSLDLRSAAVRRTIRLTLPVYLGESGNRINVMVSRAFASLLPAGAVSGLQYAQTLSAALPTIVAGALTTALFPFLSQQFAQADERDARASLRGGIVTVLLVFLPLSAGIWLLARLLVWVLFEHGAFGAASTDLTVTALQIFAPTTFAIALNALIGSAFQARHDTLTPTKAGLVRVTSNLALCLVLVPVLGYRGVALASTAALYLKLLVLLVCLRGILDASELLGTLVTGLRVLSAVGMMVALLYPLLVGALHRTQPLWVEILELLILASLGALAYTAGLWIFCRDVLLTHVAMARDALGRRGTLAASGLSISGGEAAP
jgi:putative peptidoglycan lipid II flippase